MKDYLSAVENVFGAYGRGEVRMPPKVYLNFEKGDLRCMPAYIPSMNIAGVKNVNVHPGNRDIPTVMATITLIDPDTGFPLAIMDGTHITNMRTGAAGGVAAKYLSRKDSSVAGFIGAGAQASTQMEAILAVRPNISKIVIFDPNTANAERLAGEARCRGLDAEIAGSVEEDAAKADILATTTPVRNPIVMAGYVKEGTHINAIGADAEGKQELDGELLRKARIVIDNWEQASHSGEINVPLSKGIITKEDIYADIGEIVSGRKVGRESDEQITVFDSTGLAIQDIASAGEILKRIMSDEGLMSEMKRVKLF